MNIPGLRTRGYPQLNVRHRAARTHRASRVCLSRSWKVGVAVIASKLWLYLRGQSEPTAIQHKGLLLYIFKIILHPINFDFSRTSVCGI